MNNKSNIFGKNLIFMDSTTYQTINSGGGPLCKLGQPNQRGIPTPTACPKGAVRSLWQAPDLPSFLCLEEKRRTRLPKHFLYKGVRGMGPLSFLCLEFPQPGPPPTRGVRMSWCGKTEILAISQRQTFFNLFHFAVCSLDTAKCTKFCCSWETLCNN